MNAKKTMIVANRLLNMDNALENGGSPTDEARQCINIAYLALEALVILPMIRLRPDGMQYAYPCTGHFKEYTEWLRCETGGEHDFYPWERPTEHNTKTL